MICSSCGRTVEDGLPFCPHCGSAVIQPFMTEEDKEREDAEVEAALRSLDQIKHTAAKPLSEPLEKTAPIGVAAVQPNYTSRRTDGRIIPLVIALAGALALAIGLFIMIPKIVKPGPSWTPTIAEPDTDVVLSPINDIPPIEELSAQDSPGQEEPLIAYDAYDHSGDKKHEEKSGYIIPDSDTRAYTVDEIRAMNLTEWDLEIARNEIYARHGRGFNDSTIQSYFDRQDWYERKYSPEEFDAMSGVMSETELANVAAISEVEDSM